jgi:hypothetical protein
MASVAVRNQKELIQRSKIGFDVELRGAEGIRTPDPLDANSQRRGRSRSSGQVAVRWQLVGVVRGCWRCCTSVLYGVRPVAAAVATPDRSGIGSACWKATVYRLVSTEAGVEYTFAAGQSG